MNKYIYLYRIIYFLAVLTTLTGCVDDRPETETVLKNDGVPAVVYASIGDLKTPETRVSKNSYDHWSVASFNVGDYVGMYAVKGRQHPEDETNYDIPVENEIMYFDGVSGTYYRFSNSDIILSPSTVSDNYSIMYYPYYKDMPAPEETANLTGLPLRQVDTDGIEKCVDFMQTSYVYTTSSTSATSYHKLPLSNGVLQPRFYHYMSELVVQRGDGFDLAKDKRVWVVMKNPYTDIRIKRTTSNYSYSLQSTLDDGQKVTLIEDETGKTTFNKHRVWQAWPGSNYSNGLLSYYVIIPPQEVSYIIIQDNNGMWQSISDFHLSSSSSSSVNSKSALSNNRYIVTVELQGLDVNVRPVIIENWDNRWEITDQNDAGINSKSEYITWVALYNSYVETRDPALENQLQKFGDASHDDNTGRTSWTFYINTDLVMEDATLETIKKLDDTLMGSSVYRNYVISGLKTPWIGEITENGSIKALDFTDMYIIDKGGTEEYTGGLARIFTDGNIDNCNMISSIIVSDKPAGIVAGYFTTGSVLNSNFSGQVIGVSSADAPYQGLFGTTPLQTPNISGTVFKELYFETYN